MILIINQTSQETKLFQAR